ncbi:Calx-beta domain-containing protein [Chitinophaga lutea]|nr:Calx-beta domain-containing protein [Chitinophaga lutea]
MKISLRFAVAALLFCCTTTVQAQVPPVVINPTGGTASDNGLKITITENSVLTEYKGQKQYSDNVSLPQLDQGMRTYYMMERRFSPTLAEQSDTLHKTACEISDVQGQGTASDPWKVVKLLSLKNRTNAIFNVSVVYTYEANKPWYRIDYFISTNEIPAQGGDYGEYLVHIYHSERTFIHETDCGLGFRDQTLFAENDHYQQIHVPAEPSINLYGRVGVRKSAGSCGPTAGSHFMKAAGGITSYNAGYTAPRDDRGATGVGYKLTGMMTENPPEITGVGMAIHKALHFYHGFQPGWIYDERKSFIVGYDETDDGPALEDATLPRGHDQVFTRAKIGLSSATPQGLEGNADHVIDGVTLHLQNAAFNLPQVVHFKITSTTTGTGDAGPGDYTVLYSKMIIPAGDYTNAHLPLTNLIIKGNTTENIDKTLKIEILPNCSPHLNFTGGGILSAVYTIVDDDENKVFVEPQFTSLAEGQQMTVTVRLTGDLLSTPLPVTVTANILTAEGTDFEPVFPLSLTIPANERTATFTFKATGDMIIEDDETLELTASAVFGPDTRTHTAGITIADVTAPANRIITFSSAPQPAFEGDNLVVTASLPAGVTTEKPIVLNIAYNESDGINTASLLDIEYNNQNAVFPSSWSIPANSNSGTLTLEMLHDNFIEPDEIIYFDVTDADNAFTVVGPVQLTLKDKVPVGQQATITINEGNQMHEIDPMEYTATIQLPKKVSQALTLNILIDPSSTASADDIEVVTSLAVTIPANQSTGTFTFKSLMDNKLEGSEHLVFTFSHGMPVVQVGGPVVIQDVENTPGNRQVYLEDMSPVNVTEGNEVNVKLTLNPATPGLTAAFPITVNIALDAASEVVTGDYTLTPAATVTFAPGETEKIIKVSATGDALIEPTELLRLSLTADVTTDVTDAGIPATESTILTKDISIEDGGSNAIIFTPDATVLDEGVLFTRVVASLSAGTALSDIEITLDGLTGSTVNAADIELPATVTIPLGASSVEFNVRAKVDDVLEEDETFQLSGSKTGFTITGTSFTVKDKTGAVAANKQFIIEADNEPLAEGGATLVWVKLPGNITVGKATEVNLASGAGTELAGGEFSFSDTKVTIPAGAGKASLTLNTTADNILELTEKLEITAAGTDLLAGVNASKMLDITDVTSTIAANKIITVTPAGATTVNEGSSITYTFKLPGLISTQQALTIITNVITTPDQAGPADFNTGYPVTVTIPASGSTGTLTLSAVSDGLIEVNEKLKLQLALAGFTFSASDEINLDVVDTDLSTSTIKLSVAPATVNEGDDVTVTATLQGFTSNQPIVVTLHRDNSSTTDAVTDHSALGTITISPNQSSGTATITALADLVLENDEQLVLGGVSASFVIDGTSFIVKDKTGTNANKTISLLPPALSLTEGDDMTIKVKLPDNITAADDIDVTLSAAPAAGAQPEGTEYTLLPATVKILKGWNYAEVVLTANTDNLIEPDEELVIMAQATVYGYGPQSTTQSIIIKDKPGNNVITITSDPGVTENGSAKIRFSLPTGVQSTGDITVQLTPGGSAVAADFEDPLPATITIPGAAGVYELQLRAKKDLIIEPLENISFTATATGYTISGTAAMDVTDADINDAAIKLVPSVTDIGEGNTLTLEAVLQNGMTTLVPIDVALSPDGGTAEASDYSALTSIRIDPGDPLSGKTNIAIPDDVYLEWAETLTIKGLAAGIPVTGTTINILDKNTTVLANKKFTLTPDAASVEEGHTVVVWLRLPNGQRTEEAITINLQSVAAGTTLDAAEYSVPASVVMAAGTDAVSFTLEAKEDNLLEPVETLRLSATASVYGTGITEETTVNVTDKSGNNIIAISGGGDVAENQQQSIRFSLPAGITSVSDIVIGLTPGGTAGAGDFTAIPSTVTIKAGDAFADLVLDAVHDGVVENTETLLLTPGLAGFTFTGTASVNVLDADAAAVVLTIAPSVTEGQPITVTATLQGGVTSTSAIDIVLTKSGSQAADDDHTPLGTLRIDAGQSAGTFIITANTDLLLERDETLVLGGSAGSIAVTGTTTVIRDATDRSITLTPVTATVTENNKVTLKISLPAGVTATENITVQLTKDNGSTVTDGEFVLPPAADILSGNGEVTFEIDALTDGILEADETLNILAAANVLGDAKTVTAAVTIKDGTNTAANTLITISGDTQVTEGVTANITFSLPAGISTDQPVVISLVPGSATPAVAAGDITGGIPLSVTIPAQGNTVTLNVAAVADAVIEPVEKLFLIPSAAGFTFSNNVMLDVLDLHHSGAITISSDKPLIREAGQTATVTVSLPGSLVAGADIRVDLQKGVTSGVLDADHSTLPPFVTIATGQHEVTFTVSAAADQVLEDTEALVLEGSAAGYSVTGTTIQVEDATSLDPLNKVLQLTPVNAQLTEGSTGDFVVRLPAGITSSKDITVQLAKTGGASTAADTDHTQLPVSITIPATRNSSDDFDISAVTDQIIEQQEKLRVDGTAPAGFTFEGTDIFINDATGQTATNREIRITPDSTVLHEGNTSKVTFALPAGITSSTDIAITVTPDAMGTAGAADYSLPVNPVILPKDQNKVTVILTAIQDNQTEPTEQLKLTGAAAGYTVIAANNMTIPGDPAPQISVTAQKTADAAEPGTHGMFSIQLSAAAPADVIVHYAMSGTATGGGDYAPVSGQAVVKAGETTASVTVSVQDDLIVEGPETAVLTLQSATFTWFGNTENCNVDNTAQVMPVADNDNAQVIIEKVADATEPATAGSVRVRFSNPQATSAVPVTVQYTVAGTALAGTDYEALTGSVIIPAGSNEVLVPIQPKDDAQLEGPETIVITLTSATGALPGVNQQVASPSSVAVNLYDNDVVSMEIFGLNQVAEGTAVPVTLKSSQAVGADIQVTIQLQYDAARTITTNVPRSGDVLTVTMPANQTEVTFRITVDENEVNDDNGYVNLVIQPFSGSGQAYGKGTSSNTATVVTDNDPLQISFKQDTARLKEGNAGVGVMPFTLQLSRMSSRAIQVQYEFADAFEGAGADKDPQRAKAGTDFQQNITSITIPPMQAEADITVPITGDIEKEADKYFAVKLTNITVSGGLNTPVPGTRRTAIGVIENDDQEVDMEIRPARSMSPNGDGKNDVWIIENIEKYGRNEVVIVNRWGGTIFKTTNYHNSSNNFNGQANVGSGTGKELPDGSYFYILQVWGSDGKVTRYNGYIVIKNGL